MAKGNKTADYTNPQPGCEYYFLVWYDTYTYELIYWEYLGDWCPDDGDNPYGNEGGGGGGGEWSPPDGTCSSCPPQLPPNEPPVDIDNDVTNPCIHGMVEAVLGANIEGKVNELIQATYGANSHLDLTITDQIPMSQANRSGEETPVYNTSGALIGSSIRLNKDVLATSSKEFIAATILHEAMHSYMSANYLAFGEEHHEAMADYVDNMAGILKQMFPSLINDAAYALAWGGLEGTFFFDNPSAIYVSPYHEGLNAAYQVHKLDGKTYGHGCN